MKKQIKHEWDQEEIDTVRARAAMAEMVDTKTFLSALDTIEKQNEIIKDAMLDRASKIIKMRKIKDQIEALEKRVAELEARPVIQIAPIDTPPQPWTVPIPWIYPPTCPKPTVTWTIATNTTNEAK